MAMSLHNFFRRSVSICALIGGLSYGAAYAQANPPASADEGFLKGSDLSLSLRYRVEIVDQDNLSRTASASTLQSLLAWRSGEVQGVQAFVEVRNVRNLFTNRFNDTINGRTDFPVVADPEATEFDQAFISFKPLSGTKITLGRQKQAWGNRRFVSKLVWRQNHRSFDGASIESKITDDLEFRYLYSFNVNRAFTDNSPVGNFDANVHLSNLSYNVEGWGKLTAYGYWLDMKDDFALALSTRTLGANFTGARPIADGVTLGYTIEAAHQKDIEDNPFDIGVGYFRAEPSINVGQWSVRAGYEVLGGNGTRGFQTPLALLHAFNGWADQFVVTPGAGLRDSYAEVKYNFPQDGFLSNILGGATVILAYHEFDSDVGSIDYGTEWDGSLSWKIAGNVSALLKFASYNADGFSTDTNKFWFQLATQF